MYSEAKQRRQNFCQLEIDVEAKGIAECKHLQLCRVVLYSDPQDTFLNPC